MLENMSAPISISLILAFHMDLFHYFESNLFTLQSMNLIIANSINSTTAFMLMRVHITGLAQSHLS